MRALTLLAVAGLAAAGAPPSGRDPAGRPPAPAVTAGVSLSGGMVVIRTVDENNDTATAARQPPPPTVVVAPPTLPLGSYHGAVPARDVCRAPKRRLAAAGLRWNETTGRVDRVLQPPAPPAPAVVETLTSSSSSSSSEAVPPQPPAPSTSGGDAPTQVQTPAGAGVDVPPTPTAPAAAAAPQLKVAPDGKRYKCCDNVDCSPGSPGWAGNCDLQVDCRFIVCPPYEVAFPELPPATPECKTWVPEEETCRCACRCVCLYSPSGKVYWVPGEPPRVDASKLVSVEEAAARDAAAVAAAAGGATSSSVESKKDV